jgi:hypothetical protein
VKITNVSSSNLAPISPGLPLYNLDLLGVFGREHVIRLTGLRLFL